MHRYMELFGNEWPVNTKEDRHCHHHFNVVGPTKGQSESSGRLYQTESSRRAAGPGIARLCGFPR